eukprot:TRINITY_DN32444_c0_g1_i1.p1 TRINITY_DN32444_c0_g1~~TRINITY_DN32444_c0_g1_i1.p1  ORF type:complete len:120 (+),score=9.11 TRINITY_DN32444_c0_g1_i1:24-383(+)
MKREAGIPIHLSSKVGRAQLGRATAARRQSRQIQVLSGTSYVVDFLPRLLSIVSYGLSRKGMAKGIDKLLAPLGSGNNASSDRTGFNVGKGGGEEITDPQWCCCPLVRRTPWEEWVNSA